MISFLQESISEKMKFKLINKNFKKLSSKWIAANHSEARKFLLNYMTHDDVFKWKKFPVTGEFPTQRPVTRSFDVFLSAPELTAE